ncbi:MAG: hypothetical protein KJ066_12745 [Acidobacteria bacterium]|nr:hypothetical protein [Acidobacteriota bacterium]
MLRLVALVSGLYHVVAGLGFFVAIETIAYRFGVLPPSPPILGDAAGLLLVGIGLGYLLPLRDPQRYRGYLWVMGPLLQGGLAALFIRDFILRGSPASFLLFAVAGGALAIWTLTALLTHPRTAPAAAVPPAESVVPPSPASTPRPALADDEPTIAVPPPPQER